jgi:hypothetical protein
MNFT